MASGTSSSKPNPSGNALARIQSGATPYLAPAGAPLVNFADVALTPAGGDLPHNNMQPFLTLNFCIALQGVFPPRT
jgi:microcystin-dependent protein